MPASGRYSITGAAAPAAAAAAVLRYSWSRLMASSSAPGLNTRATKVPGVLTL